MTLQAQEREELFYSQGDKMHMRPPAPVPTGSTRVMRLRGKGESGHLPSWGLRLGLKPHPSATERVQLCLMVQARAAEARAVPVRWRPQPRQAAAVSGLCIPLALGPLS